MKRKWFVLVLVLSAVFLSCSNNNITSTDTSNLYIPTANDTTLTATLDELTKGRSLYIQNCNKCHQLYSPEKHSSSEWNSIIPQMAPKTSMTSTEIELVSKYLCKGK
jgi:hypothetical protein